MSDPSKAAEKSDEQPISGWERHELEQLRRLAKLSFAEKLEWLEQAQRVADHLRRSRENAPTPHNKQ
jgi:hypothetical protein